MNKHLKQLSILAAFAFALIPALALAEPSTTQMNITEMTARPDIQQIRERAKARAEEIRTNIEERKAEIMQRVEERRAQIKTDVCERRQERLERVIPRLSQGATSIKSSIDNVYARVTGFYESGQLTVKDYDTLVSGIEVAKANTATAITAIENQTFKLDCNNPSVGQQLDGYRLAVRDAKETLKAYRKSVVELISSMRAAASIEQGSDAGDTGANQNNQEDTINE